MNKFLLSVLLLLAAPAFGAQMKVQSPPSAVADSQTVPALTSQQAKEIYILLQGAPMNVRDMQEVAKLLDILAAIANSGK